MVSFSPTTLSLVALGLSTISIIMSAFSLRGQGMPNRFEVQRRAMEKMTQTNPDRRINDFRIHYITVTEDGGLTSTAKKYAKGHIRGHTQVFVSLDAPGKFADDFEGEYEFDFSLDHPMPVTINAPAEVEEQRLITLQTTDSQEIYGMLQWLLIDILPEHVAETGSLEEKSKTSN